MKTESNGLEKHEEIRKVTCHFYKNSNVLSMVNFKQKVNMQLTKDLSKYCDIKASQSIFRLEKSYSAKVYFIATINKSPDIDFLLDIVVNNEWKSLNGLVFYENKILIKNFFGKQNHDIKFIDLNTLTVSEQYSSNKMNIFRELGYFDSSFTYHNAVKKKFENRRIDFQKYPLKILTENEPPFTLLNLENLVYDHITKTYDVTETAQGIFIEIIRALAEYLNLSISILKINKKLGSGWGAVKVLENGTILTTEMIDWLVNDKAEMIGGR